MASLSLSSATTRRTSFLYGRTSAPLSARALLQPKPTKLFLDAAPKPISLNFCPLRFSTGAEVMKMTTTTKRGRRQSTVCRAVSFTVRDLQWISAVSSVVLMMARGTAVQKSFVVPLFILQAPSSLISWMRSEYGLWSAFLGLLVRIFFHIPGELELPFLAFLTAIVAPKQVMNLRHTPEGTIISVLIGSYLLFQHFTRIGSFREAFDKVSIVATLAIICVTAVPLLFLL